MFILYINFIEDIFCYFIIIFIFVVLCERAPGEVPATVLREEEEEKTPGKRPGADSAEEDVHEKHPSREKIRGEARATVPREEDVRETRPRREKRPGEQPTEVPPEEDIRRKSPRRGN